MSKPESGMVACLWLIWVDRKSTLNSWLVRIFDKGHLQEAICHRHDASSMSIVSIWKRIYFLELFCRITLNIHLRFVLNFSRSSLLINRKEANRIFFLDSLVFIECQRLEQSYERQQASSIWCVTAIIWHSVSPHRPLSTKHVFICNRNKIS